MGGVKRFLKQKVQASSLTEVIVATTILMLVFGIALATIQATLRNSLHKNTMVVDGKLNRLMYNYQNKQLNLPVAIDTTNWAITIQKAAKDTVQYIIFEAINRYSKKKITKKLIANEE